MGAAWPSGFSLEDLALELVQLVGKWKGGSSTAIIRKVHRTPRHGSTSFGKGHRRRSLFQPMGPRGFLDARSFGPRRFARPGVWVVFAGLSGGP